MTGPLYAAGCDYSTHAIHLAVVGRDEIAKVHVARIEHMEHSERVTALVVAFNEVRHCAVLEGIHAPTVLIEQPFHHEGNGNASTTIILSMLCGELMAAAVMEGFTILRLMAGEWRALAGVANTAQRFTAKSGRRPGAQPMRHLGRADLKAEALRLVKLEYGVDFGKDDNSAEAVLMARVALGIARRDALVASA